MKKATLLLFATAMLSVSAFAQSGTDLEFSQTLNIATGATNTYTVPAGKILKIVGFSLNGYGASGRNLNLNVDGSFSIYLRYFVSDDLTADAVLPIFVNENQVITLTSSSGTNGVVSCVEYTVIP